MCCTTNFCGNFRDNVVTTSAVCFVAARVACTDGILEGLKKKHLKKAAVRGKRSSQGEMRGCRRENDVIY